MIFDDAVCCDSVCCRPFFVLLDCMNLCVCVFGSRECVQNFVVVVVVDVVVGGGVD